MTKPREIPILRNGAQVRAILAGATQMRVPVKEQPTEPITWHIGSNDCEWFHPAIIRRGEEAPGPLTYGFATEDEHWKSPFAPGDLLYCKETWATHEAFDDCPPRIVPPEEIVWYRTYSVGICEADGSVLRNNFHGRIRNAVHMPKWAARIWLRVNRVWVEQVQSISEADAIAENSDNNGEYVAYCPDCRGYGIVGFDCDHSRDCRYGCDSPTGALAALWDSIYGKKFPWSDNPWVFGCEFERIER